MNMEDLAWSKVIRLSEQRRNAIRRDAMTMPVKTIAAKYKISRQRVHQIIGSIKEFRVTYRTKENK